MRVRLAVAALVALGVLLVGTPAWGHAVLEETDPGAGATVVQAPEAVTLTFSESVQTSLGGIRVFDSRGRRVDVGEPEHPNGNGREVRAALPELDDGTYVVTWRVTSVDSHPIRGAFTFSVGTASASSREASGLAQRLLSNQGGSSVVGAGMAVARMGVFLGVTVLIGAAAFLAVVWRAGRSDRRARRVVWAAWGVALGATVVGFLLQGPYLAGEGLAKAIDSELWSQVFDTRFGHVWSVRSLILLVAVPLLRMLMPRGPVSEHPLPAWWPAVAGVLGVALAATPAFAGHPSAGRWVALAVPADTVHVAAVGLWLGGLVMLGVALLRRDDDEDTLRAIVPRYSSYALVAVALIVLSGAFQMIRQVDRLGALTDTDYGRLLSLKLIVFVGLLAVAAYSRDVVNRRWRVPAEVAHAPATVGARGGLALADPELAKQYPDGYVLDEPVAERRLRRSVVVELVISAVILAVTALLVDAAPPREEASGPFQAVLTAGDVRIDTVFTPARRGPNELHLTAQTPSGALQDTIDMTAQLSQPDNDIAPIDIRLVRAGPGHYISRSFVVPFAGDWELTVKALVTDVQEVTATAEVPVR